MKTPSLLALALLLPVALSANEEPKLEVAGLNFSAGAPWKSVPSSSPMRAGTLQIAVAGQEKPLEAVFFYFGAGQGGDVEANVQRWYKQFEGKPETGREQLESGGKKITLVTGKGTFLDGAPMGPKTPKPGYMLLGAIVPAADANVFIKLTGPEAAVNAVAGDFKKLAASPFVK